MSTECSEDDLPLVTIITPTYNSNPQYLKEAIESVLEQTYPKIEYIITDDGSSVFHEELIHELLGVRNRGNVTWKIIRHDENVGTVKNMNGAIRESHGEYIFPLAHDDVYYDSDVISDWVKKFQETGVQVITSMREEYGDKFLLEKLGVLPNSEDVSKIIHYCPKDLYREYCLRKVIIAGGSSIAYSRQCLENYKLYDERFRLLEDWSTINKLLRLDVKIGFLDQISIRHRAGGVSDFRNPNIQLVRDDILVERDRLFGAGKLGVATRIYLLYRVTMVYTYYRYLLLDNKIKSASSTYFEKCIHTLLTSIVNVYRTKQRSRM